MRLGEYFYAEAGEYVVLMVAVCSLVSGTELLPLMVNFWQQFNFVQQISACRDWYTILVLFSIF